MNKFRLQGEGRGSSTLPAPQTRAAQNLIPGDYDGQEHCPQAVCVPGDAGNGAVLTHAARVRTSLTSADPSGSASLFHWAQQEAQKKANIPLHGKIRERRTTNILAMAELLRFEGNGQSVQR